jgi:hypothetical protein
LFQRGVVSRARRRRRRRLIATRKGDAGLRPSEVGSGDAAVPVRRSTECHCEAWAGRSRRRACAVQPGVLVAARTLLLANAALLCASGCVCGRAPQSACASLPLAGRRLLEDARPEEAGTTRSQEPRRLGRTRVCKHLPAGYTCMGSRAPLAGRSFACLRPTAASPRPLGVAARRKHRGCAAAATRVPWPPPPSRPPDAQPAHSRDMSTSRVPQ